MRRPLGLALLLCAALFLNACGDSHEVLALHDPTGDFSGMPYPTDERLHADGTIDLTAYTRGLNNQVDEYLTDMLLAHSLDQPHD